MSYSAGVEQGRETCADLRAFPGDCIDLRLPCELTVPGRARAEIRAAARGRLTEAESATAVLLTSELVTNAVIHPQQRAHATIGLRITSSANSLFVEVWDGGSGFDLAASPLPKQEVGGNGLLLVERLARRWGTKRKADGQQQRFCVWFELERAQRHSEPIGADR